MSRPRAWSYLLLLPVLLLLMGGRQVPLSDPEPIAIPAGLNEALVTKAIKAALVGLTWDLTEVQPGRILSTLNLRTHMAKIEVAYDDQAIRIRYLDSSELMYAEKKGERLIHRNYLNWVQRLSNDIAKNLQLVAP